MRSTLFTTFFILFCILPRPSSASADAPPRSYQTARVSGQCPRLDGDVEDPVWDLVDWSGDFIQRTPEDGAPPSKQTEFKMLYDDEAVYFAFRLHDDPSLVRSLLARRDWFPGDWIEVNIDSYHDRRTAFSFTLSLSGTRGDEFISNDGNGWDGSWDPVWEGATQIDDRGWTAEMRIPLSQLRFDSDEEQVWGLQVQRRIFREEERSTWQCIPKDSSGWVSQFGQVHGIRGIRPGRRVEIMPYGLARGERFEKESNNPFRDGSSSDMSFGMDGKIGLTSNLTADFTINPDFGQVEADPSQVNLTAFETYFSEKRPFFIEGSDIFNLPMAPAITGGHFTRDRLFYSRRIGKSPAYYPDLEDDEFAEMPENTSILGALKLSGKTASGMSIGILEGVTARERAEISGPAGSRDTSVEPATNYFVGRMMQDFREGNTVVGAMVTAVNRDIEDEHLEFLRRSAYAGGVDLQHYFHDRDFRLEARFFGSHLRGTEEAIDQVQTSSARYFQRPDNDHTDYDPTRTTINGSAGSLLLTRTGNNSNLMFQTGAAFRSPGFEINDIGYMRRADEINQSTWMGYTRRNPFSIFNRWQLNSNQWLNWDWGGNFLGSAFNFNSSWEFRNRCGGYWSFTRNNDEISNTELRGGPASKWPGSNQYNFQLYSDSSRDWQISGGTWTMQGDESYAEMWEYFGQLRWMPSNAIQVRISPNYKRNLSEMQYVGTFDNDGDDRYLFGKMNQKTFSLTFRLDYCIRPNLTLQYYGSPFVSAGDFESYKRITRPRADAYADRFHPFTAEEISWNEADGTFAVDEDIDGTADYEFNNPDFNIRDFNSNLVLRWEYQPGSTLFLVWSQARGGYLPSGDFDLRDDMDGLFGVHPHNVFLIKLNKWFSL